MDNNKQKQEQKAVNSADIQQKSSGNKSPEIGGPNGPEPTRYGDWERYGRCIDF